MSKEYEIRPYQTDAVAACLAGLRETDHVPRGILRLPTGAGKTNVFSQIIQEYTRTGLKILVIVHRKELIEQVRLKLLENGVIAEVEQAGKRASQNALVVIASVQSLQVRDLPDIRMIISPLWLLMNVTIVSPLPTRKSSNISIRHQSLEPVLPLIG